MENEFQEIEDLLDKMVIEFVTEYSKKHFLSLSQLCILGELYKEELINKYILNGK